MLSCIRLISMAIVLCGMVTADECVVDDAVPLSYFAAVSQAFSEMAA